MSKVTIHNSGKATIQFAVDDENSKIINLMPNGHASVPKAKADKLAASYEQIKIIAVEADEVESKAAAKTKGKKHASVPKVKADKLAASDEQIKIIDVEADEVESKADAKTNGKK